MTSSSSSSSWLLADSWPLPADHAPQRPQLSAKCEPLLRVLATSSAETRSGLECELRRWSAAVSWGNQLQLQQGQNQSQQNQNQNQCFLAWSGGRGQASSPSGAPARWAEDGSVNNSNNSNNNSNSNNNNNNNNSSAILNGASWLLGLISSSLNQPPNQNPNQPPPANLGPNQTQQQHLNSTLSEAAVQAMIKRNQPMGAPMGGAGAPMGGLELLDCWQELQLEEYYSQYDLLVGLRTASTLTLLFAVFILFVVYKTGCGGPEARHQSRRPPPLQWARGPGGAVQATGGARRRPQQQQQQQQQQQRRRDGQQSEPPATALS